VQVRTEVVDLFVHRFPLANHPLSLGLCACGGAHLLIEFVSLPFRTTSLALGLAVERGSRQIHTVKRLITALASLIGILLPSSAAISCTAGEAVPPSSTPECMIGWRWQCGQNHGCV
jgi:hypothetical protein